MVVPTPVGLFIPSAQMPHNLWLTVESGLALFGADFFGMRLGPAAAAVLLHFAGVGLVAWACCIAARRLLPPPTGWYRCSSWASPSTWPRTC